MAMKLEIKALKKEIEGLKIYRNLIFEPGDEIKNLRKKYKISQNALAKMVGKTQPFIARIEKRDVSPSIDTLRTILEKILDIKKSRIKAIDVATTPVDYIRVSQRVSDAVKILDTKGYSQIIVMDKSATKVIGSISVKRISEMISEKGNAILKELIGDHHEKPFPTINRDDSIDVVTVLLKYNDAILVLDDESSLIGIITHSDLLKSKN